MSEEKNEIVTVEVLQNNFASLKKNNIEKFELKISEAIEAYPYVEITDSESYKEAKKNRTGAKGVRVEVEKGDKALGTLFTNERKDQKNIAAELVGKIKPIEDKQQEEIDRWDNKKAEEKKAKAEAEEKRIEIIKNKIEEIKQGANKLIDACVYDSIETTQESLESLFKIEFDFQEFEILLDTVEEESNSKFELTVEKLIKGEEQRIQAVKEGQQAKYNECKLYALETINEATVENLDLAQSIKTYFQGVAFDFGDLKDSFLELAHKSVRDAEKKVIKLKDESVKNAKLKALEDAEEERLKKEKAEKKKQESIKVESEHFSTFSEVIEENINNIGVVSNLEDVEEKIKANINKTYSAKIYNEENQVKANEYFNDLSLKLTEKIEEVKKEIKALQEQEDKQKEERVNRLAKDKTQILDFSDKMTKDFYNHQKSFCNDLQPETNEFIINLNEHFDTWIKEVKQSIENY